ncbi:MAG: FlgD immunoglobulin-like domain containing protein, partial [Actinomycetes bacterium]
MPQPVKYTLARDGNVSLALYDAQGTLVRELLRAVPQKAGKQSVVWDGRDQNAQPVGSGSYHWKVLQTPGLTTEYVMMLGTRTSPGYADWPGDHGGPSAVAVDETGLYEGAIGGETVPVLVKQSLDGTKRQWIHFHYHGWSGPVKLAATGGRLYMHDGGSLLTINRDTGEKTAECKLKPGAMIAARADSVVAAYRTNNLVEWINPQDGVALDSAAVDAPTDAAITSDGSVLILTSNTVVSLTRADHKPVERIGGLTAAQRIAVDEVSGDIFVVEAGDSQQIKRFDASFALQATYGNKGGRPREGRYDQPTSFFGVTGICGDRQGGFLITEDGSAPRRTSHFNAKGELVSEWYGGQQFFEYASPDPQNPAFVWFDSAWGWLVQAEVDYSNKTWKVHATYSYLTATPGLFDREAKLFGGWHVAHRNNQTYLWADYGFPRVVRVDEANRRLVPVAAIGLADPAPQNPPAGQPRPPAAGP